MFDRVEASLLLKARAINANEYCLLEFSFAITPDSGLFAVKNKGFVIVYVVDDALDATLN